MGIVIMRGPKTTTYKNITRIDHSGTRTHGYHVRVTWQGQTYGRFFSDRKYGAQPAALEASIAWRNQTEIEIGKPRTEHRVIGWHSRNNTGVVGVRRRLRGRLEVFEATWMVTEDGKRTRRATCFSIARHGEKMAYKLALRARRRGERMRWSAPRVRRDPSSPSAG